MFKSARFTTESLEADTMYIRDVAVNLLGIMKQVTNPEISGSKQHRSN
ncbi:MAG: hypothetical protein IKN04_13710 [Clostridia bacterium]|nr:hypothetical protein [Clostridia bacterium]